MAAFEQVSRVLLQRIGSDLDIIDVRVTELPFVRPTVTKDFDPRSFRTPKVEIKPWMAYFNLLRAAVGVGMLGAPMAMSQGGMLFGPILCLVIGGLLVHTHLILATFEYRKVLMESGSFIALFMVLSQLGISSIQLIFITDNIRDIMDWPSSKLALAYVLVPLLILELSLKNLKWISHVVMTGNAMNVIAIFLVLWQIFNGPRREHQLMPWSWTSLLVAIGTMMFNLSAVGVILACEKSLKNPKLMLGTSGVVFVGLMVPSGICVVFGCLGFWSFGVMEENVLRYLPFDETITTVVLCIYTISVALTYPLACYPAVQIILEVIKNHDSRISLETKTMKALEFITRPIFLMFTFLFAYLFPFQTPYVSVVGCLCTTVISIIFPALMEIGLCYPNDYGPYKYILVKDLLLLLFGVIVFVTGVSMCGKLMYKRILEQRSPLSTSEGTPIEIGEMSLQDIL